LLCADYAFTFDDSGLRKADLVGFAQLPRDVRSACIAVIDKPTSDPRAAVSSYYRLGAPVVFVCNGALQRWKQTADPERPVLAETVDPSKVSGFFQQHKLDLSPHEVFRRKILGRVRPDRHPEDFVDAGLLPAVESEVGARLTKRVEKVIDDLSEAFDRPVTSLTADQRSWILESTFYLLAGKLLKDKAVGGFKSVTLEDVDDVFRRVTRHYRSERPPGIDNARQRRALVRAAKHFGQFRYMGHITTDTLADVYEAALIDPKKRKALGTHSTPAYIVDWVVWQLAPWIEQMDALDRNVLEPACGHAPFLVSAMRLLRFLLPPATSHEEAHDYLKDRLHGLEKDDRAREVARLSLTLADVPNPNGWRLDLADMFEPGVIEAAASTAKILLCNPPFEEFTDGERSDYAAAGAPPVHAGKAQEMLRRALPNLPMGAVIGVVLPQAVLQSNAANAIALRDTLVHDFQILDVCLLNDKFFRYADHETALLLGRKVRSRALVANRFTCRKVRESETNAFKLRYRTTTEINVAQAVAQQSRTRRLWIPDLPDLWEWCQNLPPLSKIAAVERGLEYQAKGELPSNAFTCGPTAPPHRGRFAELRIGYAKTSADDRIDRTPREYYMNLASDVVGVRRGGAETGQPQIILSYVRVSRGPWRWKGFIDGEGRPFESCFLGVRPSPIVALPLEFFWALLNSPLANAFLYCHTMKRQNLKGLVEQIPFPVATPHTMDRVVECAVEYLAEARKPLPESMSAAPLFTAPNHAEPMNRRRVLSALLRLDSEVLRLYDLPAAQERALLNSFAGYERPGLPPGVVFNRYYPDRFRETIPLHVYLSSAYERQRTTGGAGYLTDAERSRLDELTSAMLTRDLGREERLELDELQRAIAADAYMTAGEEPWQRLAALEAAGDITDRRLSRIANDIITRKLKGETRGGPTE
jgi:hypothetical protein